MRRRSWVIALAVVIAGAWAAYAITRSDAVKNWCRNNVAVGDYITKLDIPQHDLVSVSNGVWKYSDGVRVTFVDSQVYEKQCG